MPRTKEYDRDQVLDQAMKVFYKKGYEGTSIQDLVDATGLNRFGMYQDFGSKGGLFLEVLDKYQKISATQLFSILEKDPAGLKSIQAFFDCMIKNFSGTKADKGCLMANTAVDLPLRCQNTFRKVTKFLKRMEDGFHRCLVQARKHKEIGSKADLRALALYLVGITQGLSVFSRANTKTARMKSFVRVALDGLQSGARKT